MLGVVEWALGDGAITWAERSHACEKTIRMLDWCRVAAGKALFQNKGTYYPVNAMNEEGKTRLERKLDSDLLVVDDNLISLRLLAAILAKRGHGVRTAEDGVAALEEVRSLTPDMVLLDVKMPQMDGYEVCRRLKEQEITADIPVIFISAQDEMLDKVRAFAVGGVDYIMKPFHADEVLARVDTHLALLEARRRQQETTASLQRHLEEIARSNAELEMLREVAETLNEATTMSEVTESALPHILGQMGARAGWLLLNDSQPATPYAQREAVGNVGGVEGDTRQLAVPRMVSLQEESESSVERDAWEIPEEAEGIASEFVSIPLQMRDRTLGTLNVVLPEGISLDQHLSQLYRTVGHQYSAALERARLLEDLQELATTDPLTGLYNRRQFFTLAQQECNRASRYRHCVSLIMIDIDHFKAVNDTHGHAVGDEILRGIAGLLLENHRSVDVPARLGGEEFVIVLPETDSPSAYVVAERLRRIVEGFDFVTAAGLVKITVSMGVACAHPSSKVTLDGLLENADKALYESKAAGRNRVTVHNM
jgi:two-component system, cell cycle response regulator